MSKQSEDIGRLIEEETTQRLEIMDRPDYVWPEKADGKDTAAIIASIVACIALIVGCMTGVIV